MALDHLERFDRWCRAMGHRPATLATTSRVLRRAERLGRPDSLLGWDRADVVDFLAQPGLTHTSRAAYASHLSRFYRWALEEGLVLSDPTRTIRRPRARRGVPRPIPTADLTMALEFSRGHWIYSALMLAAYAGLRSFEVCRCHGRHLDRGAGVLRLVERKGGDPGHVPCPPILLDHLDTLPRADWWFPSPHGGPMREQSVEGAVNAFLHALGITSTMHQVRHWYGTELLEACGDLRVVQECMGHRSPATTAIYTLVRPARAAAAVARLPALSPMSRLNGG